MTERSEALIQVEGMKAAMTCEDCRTLLAIVPSGLVCVNGCGRVLPFGLVAERYNLTRLVTVKDFDRTEITRQVEQLLRSAYPQQVSQPRTAGEILPPSPGAAGSRRPPLRQRSMTPEEWDELERDWRRRNLRLVDEPAEAAPGEGSP